DKSAGTGGSTADTTATGGATAFSNISDTASITIIPIADQPSVTGATTNEDTQTSSGLVITRNAVDGAEVGFFKITGITNGTLFQNDGTPPINSNDFITFAQGNAGLKFTPTPGGTATSSFQVQSSVDGIGTGLSPG